MQENTKYCVILVFETVILTVYVSTPCFQKLQKPCLWCFLTKDLKIGSFLADTKYALPKDGGVIIAELPSLPIPKGNASSSILAFILISEFVDHLPLYRLLQIFKRQELIISKSIIGGWVAKTSELLEPLV